MLDTYPIRTLKYLCSMIPDSYPQIPDSKPLPPMPAAMGSEPVHAPCAPAIPNPPAHMLSGGKPATILHSRPAGDFMEGILAAARAEPVSSSMLSTTSARPDAQEADFPCNIAPRELPDGSRLHTYRVQRCIGRGGFGVTYLARESLLNRLVVIKENFPDSLCYREAGTLNICMHNPDSDKEKYEWAYNNFLREVRLLANLDHSCIAKVYSFFQEHNTAYYVVEYINGISLDKLAAQHAANKRPITQSSLFGLMVRLLDALDYLHSHKLLHRDIKPDNILITRAGLPVIIDFGAAREAYGDISDNIVETPGFSPAEQSTADGNMGPWTDIYAFGATLYYTLTGTSLPPAKQRLIYDTADPLSANPALLNQYHPSLLATIDRAIAPQPERRYQSVAEWMHDLAALHL